MDKDVSELSGGQRSKVLLTKLLLQNSQILLLDEPTNYLDVEHIEWLTKFLQNYEHAFILISHDIPFLNKVVNVIYHLENCELTRYSGDYDKFQEMYAIYQSQKAAATSVNSRRLLSWRTSSPATRRVLLPPIWQKAANASWIRWK